MTLNEEVARALGRDWFGGSKWRPESWSKEIATPDFEHDWNAVYRWIVSAVKEMEPGAQSDFMGAIIYTDNRPSRPAPFIFYATPEDYCRAFLKVKAG